MARLAGETALLDRRLTLGHAHPPRRWNAAHAYHTQNQMVMVSYVSTGLSVPASQSHWRNERSTAIDQTGWA